MRQRNERIEEPGVMGEVDGFLKRCSKTAFLYFTGERPMTQAGFELCLEEMVQLDYTRLYSAFSGSYPEMLDVFNRQAEELERRGREAGLPEEVKQKMWDRILENIGEKERTHIGRFHKREERDPE